MPRDYNIFVLGAGFSAHAGIPLAKNLWQLILAEAKQKVSKNGVEYSLYEKILKNDIDEFIDYHNNSRINKKVISDEHEIDLEEFVSYLDIEDFLRLSGSDHWSKAGNQSQILIRNYIANIIYQRQHKVQKKQLKLYDEFVKKLKPKDLIITFNYDTIVEDAFKRNNIPFRYYWEKSSHDEDGNLVIDLESEDIILHKMHGSIDWVSDKYFLSDSSLCIWNRNKEMFSPLKILTDPFDESIDLQHIYHIKNLGNYFTSNEPVLESPFIISPSFNKIVMLNPLKEFWNGFIGNGQASKRLVFIGFSLPLHDDYIRQPIYSVAKNFEAYAKEDNRNISLIDFQNDPTLQKKVKDNYTFLNEEITNYYFDGFSIDNLNKIFL